jgi:hypothetical protein
MHIDVLMELPLFPLFGVSIVVHGVFVSRLLLLPMMLCYLEISLLGFLLFSNRATSFLLYYKAIRILFESVDHL